MKYFLPKFCLALKLTEYFHSQSCTRNSAFSIQIDNHYDDTILTVQLLSPSFLSIPSRSITSNLQTTVHSLYPLSIQSICITPDSYIILDTSSLIFFDTKTSQNATIMQYFMHPLIAHYTNFAISSYIILYNTTALSIFTYDKQYPKFIADFYCSANLTFVRLFKEFIILADNTKFMVLVVDDCELGILSEVEKLYASEVNLTEFRISDMVVHQDSFFVIDQGLGLCQMALNPIRVLKFFDLYGFKLTVFQDSLCIDGKFVVNLQTYQVISYNLTVTCEFLSLDLNFIYCGNGDHVTYISRLLPIQKTFTTRDIKAMVAKNSMLFTAFKDSVVIEEVRLSPIYLTGTVPSEVSEYKVEFQVWSADYETDKEDFTLKILYNLTDVIIFIVFCLLLVFGIVACALVWIRICKAKSRKRRKRRESVENVVVENQTESVRNAMESVRNPFSERRLVERMQ